MKNLSTLILKWPNKEYISFYHSVRRLKFESKFRSRYWGKKMNHHPLYTIDDAARQLAVSKALIHKFIKMGLVIPDMSDPEETTLTPYGLRRLTYVVDLYEKSYSTESIEVLLNR